MEADVQAVLEDNHASQAALLQDGPLQPGSRRSSGSGGQPGPRASRPASAAGSADAKSRENACPNSPPTAPPAVVNCGTPAAAAVPEARVTVTIGDSCTAPASSPAETEQLGEGQATQVEVAGSGVAPAAALPLAEGAGPQLEAAGGGEGETGSLDAAGDFDDLDALD